MYRIAACLATRAGDVFCKVAMAMDTLFWTALLRFLVQAGPVMLEIICNS